MRKNARYCLAVLLLAILGLPLALGALPFRSRNLAVIPEISRSLKPSGVTIVYIVGALRTDYSITQGRIEFQEELRSVIPSATLEVFSRFYWPWEIDVPRLLARAAQAQLDDGRDIILVGTSIAGGIVQEIASGFKRSRVLGVVTAFAPHNLWWLWGIATDDSFCHRDLVDPLDPLILLPWSYRFNRQQTFTMPHGHMLFFSRHMYREIANEAKEIFEFYATPGNSASENKLRSTCGKDRRIISQAKHIHLAVARRSSS